MRFLTRFGLIIFGFILLMRTGCLPADSNTLTVNSIGTATWKGETYTCALGRSGVGADKMEGDGKTPEGTFLIKSEIGAVESVIRDF